MSKIVKVRVRGMRRDERERERLERRDARAKTEKCVCERESHDGTRAFVCRPSLGIVKRDRRVICVSSLLILRHLDLFATIVTNELEEKGGKTARMVTRDYGYQSGNGPMD